MRAAALIAAMAASRQAQELRIGLQDDADVLDPDQSHTFVGLIVYTALCDKLVDIDPDLNIVPRLATDWSWSDDETELTMSLREGVVFHDGTPFNAEAMITNIDRSQNLPGSRRKSGVASVTAVGFILMNLLADTAYMILNPRMRDQKRARSPLRRPCACNLGRGCPAADRDAAAAPQPGPGEAEATPLRLVRSGARRPFRLPRHRRAVPADQAAGGNGLGRDSSPALLRLSAGDSPERA